MKFNEELKMSRKTLDLTQVELANILKTSRRTIQDWEKGLVEPPVYAKKLLIKELKNMIKEK